MNVQQSGKFSTHVPPQYRDESRKILYIGKATAGEFKEPEASATWFNKVESDFWRFARKVSALANQEASQDLRNVAWSNIFKQGVTSGNPGRNLAKEQWSDAVQALQTEAAELQPDLILS